MIAKIVLFIFVLSLTPFLFNQDAFATNYDVYDQTSCENVLSGTWNIYTDVCELNSSLTLLSDDIFTLEVALKSWYPIENYGIINADASIVPRASLYNYGTINTGSYSITIYSDSEFINYGTLNLEGNITVFGGIFSNEGTLIINGELSNYGDIVNNGFIESNGEIFSDNYFENNNTLKFNNIFENEGTINNNGFIESKGIIDNDGNFDNNDTFVNFGTLDNDGNFDNNDTFVNFGTLDNDGNFDNNDTFDNNGIIDNDGNFWNDGIINDSGIINDDNDPIINNGLVNIIITVIEDVKKKNGSGCADCTPPTLGLNKNYKRVVDNGFSYNNNTAQVEKWHTPYPLINATVGETNTVEIIIYENQGIGNMKMVQFGLGGEEIAQALSTFEVIIEVPLFNNMTSGNTETDEIIITDKDNLIENSSVNATTSAVKCMDDDTNPSCLKVVLEYSYRESTINHMMVVNVVDKPRNDQNFYFNEGVQVLGESQNPAPYYIMSNKKTAQQTENLQIVLIREDKVNNIWVDGMGVKYLKVSEDRFDRITPADSYKCTDPPLEEINVPTRSNCHFRDLTEIWTYPTE